MTRETVISHLRFNLEDNTSPERQMQRVHLRPNGVAKIGWQRWLTLQGGTQFPGCMEMHDEAHGNPTYPLYKTLNDPLSSKIIYLSITKGRCCLPLNCSSIIHSFSHA